MADLNDLVISSDLSALLQSFSDYKGIHSPRMNLTRDGRKAIPLKKDTRLPDNIDLFAFSRFVKENFVAPNYWGQSSNPLRHPIIKGIPVKDHQKCTQLNKTILRYACDGSITGAPLKLYSDYIVNTAISNPSLADELLVQIASLTWVKRLDPDVHGRLWRLLAHCLSCICPSPKLHSFLLKYVSDHGKGDSAGHLQNHLLVMPKSHLTTENRLHPPSVIEWEANSTCCNMALEIHLPDDSVALIGVDPWATSEEVANAAVQSKGYENPQGWSLVLEQDNGLSTEISGNDYVLDLISSLELYPGLQPTSNNFLKYERSDQKNLGKVDPRKDPVQVQPTASSQVPRSREQSGNFSFGPPNLQNSVQASSNKIHRYSVDQASGSVHNNDLSSRIKGGGRMMGMNGMGYNSGMGMMQQQPMMMNQPMMQMQPMQMQQPMMQPPFGQPMMQMQPNMMMQQQQPFMGMPSSVGMMSSGMNPMQQQMMMQMMKQQQKDQKKWLKMMTAEGSSDEEMGKNRHRNLKEGKKWGGKQSSKHEKEYKPVRSHMDSESSDEEYARRQEKERRKPSDRYRHDSDKKKGKPQSLPQRAESRKSHKPPLESRSSDEERSETDWKMSRQMALEKKERDQENDSSREINQGTVRMSFNEKKKFFMQKALAESQANSRPEPYRPQKKSFLNENLKNEASGPEVKTETKIVPPVVNKPSTPPMPPVKESPKPLVPVKDPEPQKNHHQEALSLLFGPSAEKNHKQKAKMSPHEEETNESKDQMALLLARQRRVVSSKQPPPPPQIVTKKKPVEVEHKQSIRKQPQPVHYSPPSSPILLPSSSDEEAPLKDVTSMAARTLVLTALLERRQQIVEQENPVQKEYASDPPPPPPPFVPKTQTNFDDTDIKTILHPVEKRAHVKYTNVKWKIRARKEIFYSDEPISNMKMIDLIYQQIIHETTKGNPRILSGYRERVKEFLGTTKKKKIDPIKKKSFVEQCRADWKLYFTRLFQIKIRDVPSHLPQTLYKATIIGVGHTGIHFVITNGTPRWQIFSFSFQEISNVQEPQQNVLELNVQEKKIALFCRKSNQLKKIILPCLIMTPYSPPASPRPAEPFDRIFDPRMEPNTEQEIKHDDIYEVLPPPQDIEEYSLLHFARKYFTKPKESGKALQHTKSTLRKPLLSIRQQQMAKAAAACFLTIQRFMGDAPSKTTSEEAYIYKLLSTCATFARTPLIDEVYMYLAKQTTNNRKQSSCIRGWRLFALYAAFHPCSKALLPHLLAHLHNIANGSSQYANGAAVSLVNLQHTLEFKGRKEIPIDVEAKALVAGRTTFEQLILLPGTLQWPFKVNTSSVVAHVIENFCRDLDIKKPEEMAEYGIFCMAMDDMGNILNIDSLVRADYLLDVLTKWHRHRAQILFMFQRVVWAQPTDYENQKLVNILLQQIISEYTSGKLLTDQEVSGVLTRSQIGDYAKIAALLHTGLGRTSLPTQEEVIQYIPEQIRNQESASSWRDLSHNHFTATQNRTPHEACSEVLGILSAKRLFGATILTEELIDSSRNANLKTIAIGTNGIFIFDPITKVLEEQYSIMCIEGVNSHYDETSRTNVCFITIKRTEEDEVVLRVKTSKPGLLTGILNHHIGLLK